MSRLGELKLLKMELNDYNQGPDLYSQISLKYAFMPYLVEIYP